MTKTKRQLRAETEERLRKALEWLDRQAAITEREREQHWLEIIGAFANCNLELSNRNAELQVKVDVLEEENRLMRERLRSIADNDVTVFGMKLDEVRNLQVENAKLREKLEEDVR